MVDAPALVEEDLRRESAGEDRNSLPIDLAYLRHMRTEHAASEHLEPLPYFLDCDDQSHLRKDARLILFTHIPLYRFPGSNCGPLREKGSIPAVRGDGYQTLLSPETSQLLLNELGPTLIFRYLLFLLSLLYIFPLRHLPMTDEY